MNPQLRRILIGGASVTTGALLVVFGFVRWLGTDSGSRFLLAQIQDAAKQAGGVALSWKEARIDPFSTISFTDLKVSLDRDGSRVEIGLPRFALRYSLSLLGRSLVIDELAVEHLSVTGSVSVPKPSSEEEAPSAPLDWIQLRELVLNPPLRIELKEAKLVDPTLDLAIHGDATTLPVDGKIQVAGTGGSVSFAWSPGRMTGRAAFGMKPGASRIQLRLSSTEAPAHEDAVQFDPEADFSGAFTLETPEDHPGEWRFDVQGNRSFAGLKDFLFRRTFRDSKAAPWLVRFHEQRLTGSAAATQEKLALNYEITGDPIQATIERPMPPLRPELKVSMTAAPDLSRFDKVGTFTLNGVPVLTGTAKGGLAGKTANVSFDVRIHSDSRLGSLSPALKTLPSIDAGYSGRLDLSMENEVEAKVSELEARFEGQKFLDGNLQLAQSGGRSTAQGRITVQPVAAFFAFAKKRDRTFTLPVDEASLLSMHVATDFQASQSTEGETTTATWKGKTVVSDLGPMMDARFDAPLEFTHAATQTTVGQASPVIEASLGGTVPAFAWKHELEAVGTAFQATVKMKGSGETSALALVWNATQDKVQARDPKSGRWVPLQGLRSTGAVAVDESGKLRAEGIHFSFDEGLIALDAGATGDLRTGRIEANGQAAFSVPKDFPEIAGNRLSGSAKFPWRLQIRGGRDIDFDGEASFKELGWNNGEYGFSGLSGRIPVNESLVRKGDSIGFARLEVPNAFERVDFDRFQPFLQEAAQTELREIRYEGRKIGPLFGFFSLRQNLLSVHQFDFRLGSRGRAYGEFYLDTNPEQLQMGMLSRLSELDLAEILPERMLKKSPEGNKRIAGRTGMVMNLTRSTVDGRMDITEIGGSQLVTMIRALDPKGKDEKLNRARAALGLAYPTFVGMNFSKGLMDMTVEMSAPLPGMTIRGVPIASMVATEFAPVRDLLAAGSKRDASKQ